jgi:hypothetical protein
VVSSSRDGSLIRWDLHRVISELYVTELPEGPEDDIPEEGRQHVGDRNSVRVVLPEVVYTLPVESADEDGAAESGVDELSAPAPVEEAECGMEEAVSHGGGTAVHPVGADGEVAADTNQATSALSAAAMVVRRLSMALVANVLPAGAMSSAAGGVHPAPTQTLTKNSLVSAGTKKAAVVPVKTAPGKKSMTSTTTTTLSGSKPKVSGPKGPKNHLKKKVSDLEYADEVERLKKERMAKLQLKQEQIKNRRVNMDKAVDRSVLLAKKQVEMIRKYL